MDTLWFTLATSVLFGGYAMSRLKTMKSKIGRGLLYLSIATNAGAILVTTWVIAMLHQRIS